MPPRPGLDREGPAHKHHRVGRVERSNLDDDESQEDAREGAARHLDTTIRFSDLTTLLTSLGFEERVKGSHHIFTLEGRQAALNLQPDGPKAKAYQVRQVRRIITEHKLPTDEGE